MTDPVIYRVNTPRMNAKGKSIYYVFECHVAPLAELIRRLNDGEIIEGNQLFTDRDAHGRCWISDRRQIGLGKGDVASVSVCQFQIFDANLNDVRPLEGRTLGLPAFHSN